MQLADGTTVMGVRFLGDNPYVRDHAPDFGLYLYEEWEPPWSHEHLDWPDFGVPDDLDALRRALTNPVHWVRSKYCYKAVETDVQEHLVATFQM